MRSIDLMTDSFASFAHASWRLSKVFPVIKFLIVSGLIHALVVWGNNFRAVASQRNHGIPSIQIMEAPRYYSSRKPAAAKKRLPSYHKQFQTKRRDEGISGEVLILIVIAAFIVGAVLLYFYVTTHSLNPLVWYRLHSFNSNWKRDHMTKSAISGKDCCKGMATFARFSRVLSETNQNGNGSNDNRCCRTLLLEKYRSRTDVYRSVCEEQVLSTSLGNDPEYW